MTYSDFTSAKNFNTIPSKFIRLSHHGEDDEECSTYLCWNHTWLTRNNKIEMLLEGGCIKKNYLCITACDKNKFTMKCKYWQSIFYYWAICYNTVFAKFSSWCCKQGMMKVVKYTVKIVSESECWAFFIYSLCLKVAIHIICIFLGTSTALPHVLSEFLFHRIPIKDCYFMGTVAVKE